MSMTLDDFKQLVEALQTAIAPTSIACQLVSIHPMTAPDVSDQAVIVTFIKPEPEQMYTLIEKITDEFYSWGFTHEALIYFDIQ